MPTKKDGNFFYEIADQIKLVWRLWRDPRVSPFLKLLPFGAILYLVSPFDMVIPLIDDVGVLWFFSYLFIELSPPDVVEEHRQAIRTTLRGEWKAEKDHQPFQEDDIHDAEFKETTE